MYPIQSEMHRGCSREAFLRTRKPNAYQFADYGALRLTSKPGTSLSSPHFLQIISHACRMSSLEQQRENARVHLASGRAAEGASLLHCPCTGLDAQCRSGEGVDCRSTSRRRPSSSLVGQLREFPSCYALTLRSLSARNGCGGAKGGLFLLRS